MLSNLTFRIISIICKIGSFLQLFPFRFNSETRELIMKPRIQYTICTPIFSWKIEFSSFKIISIVLYLNFIFGIFRLFQSIYFLQKSFQDIMFNLFIVLVNFLGNVIQLSNFLSTNDLMALINQFIKHEKRLTGELLRFILVNINLFLWRKFNARGQLKALDFEGRAGIFGYFGKLTPPVILR